MFLIEGKGASEGIAVGPLLVKPAKAQSSASPISTLAPEQEVARFQAARQQVLTNLEKLRVKAQAEAGEEEAAIFEVHQLMLQDPDLNDACEALMVQDHLTAEAAAREATAQFAAMLESMDDEYMQGRAADVRDIGGQLDELLTSGKDWTSLLTRPSIIYADDLTPSEGSSNSHTSILARTMKIPAIAHTGQNLTEEQNGILAAMDGGSGALFLEPDEGILKTFKEKAEILSGKAHELDQFRGRPTMTASGKGIALYANVGGPEDMPLVRENDAEGVGLFRSEFLYLGRDTFPTEEELFTAYRDAAVAMEGRRLIIRTLDIGADKKAGYFDLPEEANPALGFRAIRICLKRPDIFYTQLRAILRASAYGQVAVMFPMITSVDEVQASKELLEATKIKLAQEGIPFNPDLEVGVMIETPAAALISEDLAPLVDFFSIGTNDLVQYTLAVDRQNAALEDLANPAHKAVLKLIQATIYNGHKAGIWVGIYGEAAANPDLIPLFITMGVDELSMAPGRILPARKLICSLTVE